MLCLFIFSFVLVSCSDDSDRPNDIDDFSETPTEEEGPTVGGSEETDCGSTNLLVGESRNLRDSPIYNISGTVTIISDCEIEFSNFNYNGLGPGVSIFGGRDNDFINGFSLTDDLAGQVFENETFSVFLPENTTLEDINSFSVWCFIFDIDFSSASF